MKKITLKNSKVEEPSLSELEQMQEKASEIMFQYFDELESCETVDQRITCKEHAEYWLTNLLTEVWNEAIKDCEGCVYELERWEATDGGEAGMRAEDHGGYIDREQTLQAISKMRV